MPRHPRGSLARAVAEQRAVARAASPHDRRALEARAASLPRELLERRARERQRRQRERPRGQRSRRDEAAPAALARYDLDAEPREARVELHRRVSVRGSGVRHRARGDALSGG
eukprot:31450-Pelagococcus_subviridis.AAC.3